MKGPDNLKKPNALPLQSPLSAEWMEPRGKAEGWMFKGLWDADEQTLVQPKCVGQIDG